MPLTALWDTETDGLLDQATKMHSLGIVFSDGRVLSCADQPGYMPIVEGLVALAEADIRVAHNGQDFDERVTRRLYPQYKAKPGSVVIDTLILSRLIFPTISRDGPNTHKVEPKLRTRHSLQAWGQRLGEPKDDYSHRKEVKFREEYLRTHDNVHPSDEEVHLHVWGTWDPEMSAYMMQDIATLKKLFTYLMSRKPSPQSVEIEHGFAAIIRRQEKWGFTVDMAAMLDLQARLTTKKAALETELIDTYGEFWVPGKITTVKATRKVKMADFPDVTQRRFGAKGNELRPYVGPPLCLYDQGAVYTPIVRTEFSPGSRDHVYKMLVKNHGWKPAKWTDKGAPAIDDDVLRGLPYPEAPKLADYYWVDKLLGYVSGGAQAWMKAVQEEGSEHRIHGGVNTIGTYTFRCSHSRPNMGQVPTRGAVDLREMLGLPIPDREHAHHPARELFIARRRFLLGGFDGSGMQLRLYAHHLAKFDGGAFARIVEDSDPHAWMRDTVGTDLMGEGTAGREKGKTLNYADLFGAGDEKRGSIVKPTGTKAEKIKIGKMIRERLSDRFPAKEELIATLKELVEQKGYIIGLDGRKAKVLKAHAALATLLQMGEGIVMKFALILADDELQRRGLMPGVTDSGLVDLTRADYEFCANVHDEAQADVKPEHREVYEEVAKWCVPEAGRRLNLRCKLKSDVKFGQTWAETH